MIENAFSISVEDDFLKSYHYEIRDPRENADANKNQSISSHWFQNFVFIRARENLKLKTLLLFWEQNLIFFKENFGDLINNSARINMYRANISIRYRRYQKVLTPMKSPKMTARRGIAKPLNREQMLATVTHFHSGLLSFRTVVNGTSGAASSSSSASCKRDNRTYF